MVFEVNSVANPLSITVGSLLQKIMWLYTPRGMHKYKTRLNFAEQSLKQIVITGNLYTNRFVFVV